MQRIKHDKSYSNVHWLFDGLEELYRITSSSSQDSQATRLFPVVLDERLKMILDIFEEYSTKDFEPVEFEKMSTDRLRLKKFDPKNIIVCYSGGKDSFSVIRHYQKLGYNVYAYHLRGLNFHYHDEWEVAEKAAEKFGFKLIIDHVSYSGQHDWVEHPMKNMIMATMALNYGIKHDIGIKIAVGTFRTARLDEAPFDVCGGDCIEMWKVYEKFVRTLIPGFRIYVPNLNYKTAYNLLKKEPESLQFTISCMTPNRFRNQFRNRTQNRYHVDLLPNRCGCCWKCATEYVWFCEHGVLEYNEEYYKHCFEVLANASTQESGYVYNVYTVRGVWDNYFFESTEPIERSKYGKEIADAVIYNGKVTDAD